ncbi:Rho GTPase activator [Grosmannia clavigera kw1407]|uniref:Rho GTPase activator n=1 Tax=Grosmannia clavigera (strain kw1407 / UAMH 11150) TaxID=655863 RepID=F0XIE3_GROCL|nr:Rho GTPase activator [Grosmannia clavigera kw1407]EFX02458.1 Rho GTPase activator [Grosmannia clavigera kw1407]
MDPEYEGGPASDRTYGHPQLPPNNAGEYPMERQHSNVSQGQSWQNSGGYGPVPGRPPVSPSQGDRGRNMDRGRDRELEPRPSSDRKHSQQGSSRTASGLPRTCNKCGEPLTGQFVRALDGTFHLDCFRCQDCGQIVASKFFPASDTNDGPQYPLCETDYFRRLGLLCYHCGGALRGSYITALDRKYHVDHFTCSLCSTVFGAQDSYYEHDGQVYCHYHYSTQFAQRCNGCHTAILKQFVEIFRNGQNQHWHPECYMIHKFWNVRLTAPHDEDGQPPVAEVDETAKRTLVREEEERMEDKVYRIWSVLSTFEESSAACISDMLLHVSNGAYVDGVLVARRFIGHVEILFRSADNLETAITKFDLKSLSYGREAKLLCKKIVAFFSLLSKSQDATTTKVGVTQELLSLVTSLAHYLKLLIRICLQGALRIEKERNTSESLLGFLDDVSALEAMKNEPEEGIQQMTAKMGPLAANNSDHCATCQKSIEDECARNGDSRWHLACVACVQCATPLGAKLGDARARYDGSIHCNSCEPSDSEKAIPLDRVTKLQQYVFLLRVALARLLDILYSSGALLQSSDAAAAAARDESTPSSDVQSRRDVQTSTSGDPNRPREPSAYENTLNDVRRLRSTRLDKHLSSSFKKTRTSRVMDGPEGSAARPGSSGAENGPASSARPGMQIVEDRVDEAAADTMLGHQDYLTLDDIPRIVAAEQAREQRPGGLNNRDSVMARGGQLTAYSNDQYAADERQGKPTAAGPTMISPHKLGGRKYFSELSGLEYFIVRHLAVMTMQPMIESEFSLEELLDFIESRKPATFWNKFGKAFKNDNKKNVKKKGIFGVPLEIIIERDGADSTDGVGPGTLRIPAIVDDIVSTMRKMDLSVEGVFRKNGNIKKLSELCEKIDRDGCDNVNLGGQNVVQVAALLKRYLRDLPDPLMTHKLYRLWLAAAKISDEDRRRQCLHLTCCLLPKCHRDCLEILFCFLKWAGSFHQVDDESGSKMDIRNLATVITPNILFLSSKVPALDSDPIFAIEAVYVLINNIEEMCLVPDDLVDVLNDPMLFSNNGEITTKEILKRFGDRTGNSAGGRPYGQVGEVMNRHDSTTRPLARRVETDPSVWKEETSVRPVQDVPNGNNSNFPPYSSGPNQSSPTRWQGQDEPKGVTPPFQAQHELADPDGQLQGPDRTTKREWRNSGWVRGNNGPPSNGSVGVAGHG